MKSIRPIRYPGSATSIQSNWFRWRLIAGAIPEAFLLDLNHNGLLLAKEDFGLRSTRSVKFIKTSLFTTDGSSWVSIDERSTQELDGANRAKCFACNAPSAEFHRFVRIQQTAPNGVNHHCMEIGQIEFFGRLLGARVTQQTSSSPIRLADNLRQNHERITLSSRESQPRRTNCFPLSFLWLEDNFLMIRKR
jgi:hypothetical protein